VAAVMNEGNVNVKWNTTEEFDVKKYYAERSIDGRNFTQIGSLHSKGNGSFGYEVNDDISNINVTTIYYRIRVEEMNDLSRYSEVVKINPGNEIRLQVSPNPFTDNISLQISNTKKTEAKIRIINATGQTLYSKTMMMDKGINSIVLNNFSNLSKGMYIVEVAAGDQYAAHRLIKK